MYFQATNPRLAGLNPLGFSVWVSRGAGLALAYDGGLILLPMLRNIIRIIRPKLAWAFPADENIWFHRQVAYSMAFWTVIHTTAHYINFINVERSREYPSTIRHSTRLTATRNPQGICSGHSLQTARRDHWPLHAPHHGSHVYHRSCQHPQTSL